MLGTLMGKNIVLSERPLWDQKLPSEQELEITSGLGAGTAQVERTSHAKALGQEKSVTFEECRGLSGKQSRSRLEVGGRAEADRASCVGCVGLRRVGVTHIEMISKQLHTLFCPRFGDPNLAVLPLEGAATTGHIGSVENHPRWPPPSLCPQPVGYRIVSIPAPRPGPPSDLGQLPPCLPPASNSRIQCLSSLICPLPPPPAPPHSRASRSNHFSLLLASLPQLRVTKGTK